MSPKSSSLGQHLNGYFVVRRGINTVGLSENDWGCLLSPITQTNESAIEH